MDGTLTPFQWFQLLQSAVMLSATVLVWLWGRTQKGAVDTALIERRITDVEKRLDRAGEKQSDLTDRIQVLPTMHQVQVLEELGAQMSVTITSIDKRIVVLETRVEAVMGPGGRRHYD